MKQIDYSKEANIKNVIAGGVDNDLILDNLNTYITFFDGFSLPSMNILFEKYRGVILENCVKLSLTEPVYNVYKYRPKFLSLKLYGYIDLWHLILWVNDMTTVTQFNKRIIYVYDPEALHVLANILNLEKELLDNKGKENPEVVNLVEDTSNRR